MANTKVPNEFLEDNLVVAGDLTVDTSTLVVDSTNNTVGIGNTVSGTINSQSGYADLVIGTGSGENGATIYSGSNGVLAFANGTAGTSTYKGFMIYAHGDDTMRFGTDAIEKVRIDSNGNIGIGTTSAGGSATNRQITSVGSATSQLTLTGSGSFSTNVGTNGTVGYLEVTGGNSLGFYTNNVERMRFNSSGGIQVSLNAFFQLHPTTGLRFNDSTDSFNNVIMADNGNVTIRGALAKGSGSFRIDHPLESKKDTHHLVHSFVEAPQADNIYRGKVDLVDGSATVNIDTVASMTEGTFVALNREVQCFTSNESDWDAVKGSVSGNILTIECQNTSSTATVSWLVIGERQDQHMYDTDWTDDNGKVIVEPLKGE